MPALAILVTGAHPVNRSCQPFLTARQVAVVVNVINHPLVVWILLVEGEVIKAQSIAIIAEAFIVIDDDNRVLLCPLIVISDDDGVLFRARRRISR